MLTISFVVRFTRHVESFPGFLSLLFVHFKLYSSSVPTLSSGQIAASEARKVIQQPAFRMDPTKRRSLQPNNQPPMPPPSVEVKPKPLEVEPRKTQTAMPFTPNLSASFEHRFYGSSLTIGEIRIGGGLSKGLHTLEITKDQLLIDSVPQNVNQGDLERIKEMIRSTQ